MCLYIYTEADEGALPCWESTLVKFVWQRQPIKTNVRGAGDLLRVEHNFCARSLCICHLIRSFENGCWRRARIEFPPGHTFGEWVVLTSKSAMAETTQIRPGPVSRTLLVVFAFLHRPKCCFAPCSPAVVQVSNNREIKEIEARAAEVETLTQEAKRLLDKSMLFTSFLRLEWLCNLRNKHVMRNSFPLLLNSRAREQLQILVQSFLNF